jgi:3',5'-cyclic AMP phosphodiesterase CpdA
MGWIPYWSGKLFSNWPGSLTQTDPPYYTVKLGDWKFIMLDTNTSVLAGSPQYDFLVDELKEAGFRTIVCGHHPRWSNGMHGDEMALDDAWKAMCDYGAVAHLPGHDHGSQVQLPRDRDGNVVQERGVVQIVAAAGGAPLYRSVTGVGHAPAEWLDDSHFCIARLTLQTSDFQAEFIADDGTILHSQQLTLAGR